MIYVEFLSLNMRCNIYNLIKVHVNFFECMCSWRYINLDFCALLRKCRLYLILSGSTGTDKQSRLS